MDLVREGIVKGLKEEKTRRVKGANRNTVIKQYLAAHYEGLTSIERSNLRYIMAKSFWDKEDDPYVYKESGGSSSEEEEDEVFNTSITLKPQPVAKDPPPPQSASSTSTIEPDQPIDKTQTKDKTKIVNVAFAEKKLNELLTKEMIESFQYLDVNGNNFLSVDDVKAAYDSFRVQVSEDDCRAIVSAFDTTGYGYITLTDFHREMYDDMKEGILEENIKLVFDMMDTDSDGLLMPDNFIRQFQKLGAPIVTHSEMIAMLTIMDRQQRGAIDYNQFRTFCFERDKVKILTQYDTTNTTLYVPPGHVPNMNAKHLKTTLPMLPRVPKTSKQQRTEDGLPVGEGLESQTLSDDINHQEVHLEASHPIEDLNKSSHARKNGRGKELWKKAKAHFHLGKESENKSKKEVADNDVKEKTEKENEVNGRKKVDSEIKEEKEADSELSTENLVDNEVNEMKDGTLNGVSHPKSINRRISLRERRESTIAVERWSSSSSHHTTIQ